MPGEQQASPDRASALSRRVIAPVRDRARAATLFVMKDSIAPLAAALSVLGFLAWIGSGLVASGPGHDLGAAGAEPLVLTGADTALVGTCLAPVAWDVGEVDPRFGLTDDDVRRAVRRAASLWDLASARPLFHEDTGRGMPIRFVYDARQERLSTRLAAELELRLADEELRRRGEAIERRDAELQRVFAEHARRASALEQAVARHNEEVREWNASGGAPDDVAAALAATQRTLEAEREAIDTEGRALRDAADAIERDAARLSESIEDRNATADELERTYAPQRVESGLYRNTIRQGRDGVVVTSPEIQVFAFESETELVAVLAHELGHALGLGHTDEEDALMRPEHSRLRSTGGPAVLTPHDVALLEEVCPADGSGAPR